MYEMYMFTMHHASCIMQFSVFKLQYHMIVSLVSSIIHTIMLLLLHTVYR